MIDSNMMMIDLNMMKIDPNMMMIDERTVPLRVVCLFSYQFMFNAQKLSIIWICDCIR